MFTPSTTLRLLNNVNLDSDYENSFTFASLSDQTAFFIGKTKNTWEDFTYVRKGNSVLVPNNIEAMWDCSYLMFQNAVFGSKWFYAFITDMKYHSDSATEIFFEIDVMQTWLFDVELKDCYVEREHVSDDSVGLHLVEEDLNIGECVIKDTSTMTALNDMAIVISTTAYWDGTNVAGDMYTGTYSGNAYYVTNLPDTVNQFIDQLDALGKSDAINNIFIMPSALIPNAYSDFKIPASASAEIPFSVDKNLTSLDGYVPKNKKLFNYPYNFLHVSNNHGDFSVFKYEYSSETTMNFFFNGDIGPNPTVYLVPKFYKGLERNYEEFMTLSNFPLCNWITDIYKIWLAQNAVTNKLNVASSALSLGVGIATASPVAIASGAIGVASAIGQFYEKSILPNPIKGSTTGGGNNALGIQNFTFNRKTIRAEFAKIIDDFFTRFGYKVNELKIPNLNSRINWNYIKLHEATISGNIQSKDLRKIHEIYKNGITLWHNDNIGDYSRDNSPV